MFYIISKTYLINVMLTWWLKWLLKDYTLFVITTTKLGADDYIHLRDTVEQDTNVNANNMGQCVILPHLSLGHNGICMRKLKMMAYVRKHGDLDLFMNFTCKLFPAQKSIDRETSLYPEFLIWKWKIYRCQ